MTNREILFIIRMRNEARQAIQELVGDLRQLQARAAAASMSSAGSLGGGISQAAAVTTTATNTIAKGANNAAAALGGVRHGSAGVTRELVVMAREAARGNFSRLVGSATILAQRLGLLELIFSPLGIAIGLAAAAIGVMEAATISAQSAVAHFQNALSSTSNYADMTTDSFLRMAQSVRTATGESLQTAMKSIGGLAATGRFTGGEINALGLDMDKFGQITGQNAAKVLQDFTKMADGPARWGEEFNRAHHAFEPAILAEIQHLEDMGDKSGATALMVKELTKWIDHQTVHLSPWEAAIRGIANAWNDAWTAMAKFNGGVPASRGDQISGLQAQLTEARAGKQTVDGNTYTIDPDRQKVLIANITQQIAALQKLQAQEQKNAVLWRKRH